MQKILKYLNQNLKLLNKKERHWKIAGSAVKGIAHEKTGTDCQDYVHYFKYGELSFMALSDGASSYKYSSLGAMTACKFAGDYFKENYKTVFKKKEIKNDFIKKLKKVLNDTAKKNKISLNELSATLLFVSIYQNHYIYGHIGDGVIGMYSENEVKVISKPENGEYVNITFFTTSKELNNHLSIEKGEINTNNNVGFILMSDGTAKSLYNNFNESFSSGVIKLFNWIKSENENMMNQLLHDNQKKILRQKTNDDCSLVLISN